jgi:hypothetical protein
MVVNGLECALVFRTQETELSIPYTEETLREAICLLEEYACIEGDGIQKAIRQPRGVTGCVVTPLTIGTAPLVLALAFGEASPPVFVSETRNVYRHTLRLVHARNGLRFDVIQQRGDVWLFEDCRVVGFELRVMRASTTLSNRDSLLSDHASAIKLRLDIAGDTPPVDYAVFEIPHADCGERFKEDGVRYSVDGIEVSPNSIYGMTLTVRKTDSIHAEAYIHRALQNELPETIQTLCVTAKLFRTRYEGRHYGTFRVTLTNLLLMSDETAVDSQGAVVGPLRYYCAGDITADVFTQGE